MEIIKGIPGLKKAGKLASNRLTNNLERNRYAPVPHTPSLWLHHTSEILFSLVVNNFGIKYTRKADADHLLKSLLGRLRDHRGLDQGEILRPHTQVGLLQHKCERLHVRIRQSIPPLGPTQGHHQTPRRPAPVEPTHIWR